MYNTFHKIPYTIVSFDTACVVILVTHNTLLDLLKTGPFDFGPFDIGSFDIHIIYHISYKLPFSYYSYGIVDN